VRHLTEGDLAGYLDRDLSDTERQRVERHLDVCDPCREELVAVAGLLDGPHAEAVGTEPTPVARPRPSRSRSWRGPLGLIGLAAAAAIAGLLLVVPASEQLVHDGQDRERIGPEGVPSLRTHVPSDGGVVDPGALHFVWADHAADSYRLTMTAEDGGLVWSVTLADTMAVPPDTLQLEPGARFFWYVDAMSAGVVARSGVRSFLVAP
jgi:hypothetical protein